MNIAVVGRLLVAMALVALLAACGGGGGGGSAPLPLIADSAADYWASGNGSVWTFEMRDHRPGRDPKAILKTVEDRGTVFISGHGVRHFVHSWSLFEAAPEDEYRYFDGREIRGLAVVPADPSLPVALGDYAEVPAPLRDGETRLVVDQTLQDDVDGDGAADTVRIEVRTTSAAEASLSVAAGDFRALLRTRQVVKATVTLARGGSGSAEAALTSWYAPGVGIVKRVYEDPSFAAPDNVIVEELVGVVHANLRAGTVAGATALDGLGAGTSSDTPGGAGVAIAPDRFMTVSATQAGSIEGAIHDAGGMLVWRGSVLTTTPPYRLQDPAVAFDGSDFRVVAVRTIPFNSPTENALMAQRVSAVGVLRDGATGTVLDSGIADAGETIAALHAAARQGQWLISWGRYDNTPVPIGPGLSAPRGYVIEGRLYDGQQQPVAPRFNFDRGLPAALAVRDDQFLVVAGGPDGSVGLVHGWAIGTDGVPVGLAPQVLARSATTKNQLALNTVAGQTWLSFSESATGATPATIVVARIGRDAVLLDGSADAPGHALLPADAIRGNGRLGFGVAQSVLAWTEGWDDVRATLFDTTVLTTGALPATTSPLAPARPNGFGPSRSVVAVGEVGAARLVVWFDNEQTQATPSDRLMFTTVQPRLGAP